jgi:hypothetical protein
VALRITIDIFSGRENPVIEVEGREAAEVLERLRPVKRLAKDAPGLPAEPTLGYRGLIVEQVGDLAKGLPRVFRYAHGGLYGGRLEHAAADPGFESHLMESLESFRRLDLGRGFPAFLREEIERFRDLREEWRRHRPPRWPVRERCRCAPLYEPAWWNVPARQFTNNCYNYGTNYRTDTYAQPGRAAGAQATVMSCAAVKPAAVLDDLLDAPRANNKCPKEGHLVALVVAPGWDYHWYRKGRNGYWTHKMGPTPATNVDNSGHLIPDPRTANRGAYTNFCAFMIVMHGHIKIS